VYKPACFYQEYEIFFIAENSTPDEYQSIPERLELSDDEIIAIQKALQKITRRRIPDASDAEDLVQDTLLTMITRNPGNKLKKGLLVWCQGILRNKVGNYYRKTQRHSSLREQNPDIEQGNQASSIIASPEITVSANELQSIIKEKVSEFPSSIRRVMELLVSGLEAGEIASQLSSESYQNVINRLYRGRKRLARELIKCGFSPNSQSGRNRRRTPGNRIRTSRKVS
jgi:RNA polymerase sigma factor (sigma-70 family)